MMKPFLLPVAGLLCAISVAAQPSLTLNGTTSLTILAGTPVSMNGLVLTPAAGFSIDAPNALNKNTTLTNGAMDGIYISSVYKWDNTLSAFNGTVGFYYADAELNGLSETTLILQLHTGVKWRAFTSNLSRNTGSNLVNTLVNNYALNELTLTDELTVLPLEWGAVRAFRKDGKAIVQWSAYDAEPGDHFIVERSSTGADWQPVGEPVPAITTPGHHTYSIEDDQAPDAQSFYRIKLVYGNGNTGGMRMTMVPAIKDGQVTVYPNPVKDKLTLQSSVAGISRIQVYDAAGKLVHSVAPGNVSFYSFDTQVLLPGYYRLRLTLANGRVLWYPVMKQ
ncbi:T9SS type A sorting domain-containing protein [Pseudoflavitalea sp. X16]|uniref:T9SS type A sorting domain-containing protein n=1 Tax=Paraflavitalea devenefica TaxID=2716334 RepID=UPI001421282F|nr:T9SS type A sorting domain-containing protein [Paraflavitalea devenefica]NII26039.1 T9SS type A sorting domain-containing protein [Paraflavitalea devenefica]